MITKIFLFISMSVIVGCAGSGGGGSSGSGGSSPSKDLKSNWVSTTNTNTHFDTSFTLIFTGLSNIVHFYTNNNQCDIHVDVEGTESAGTFDVSASTYIGTGSDPGCSALIGNYNFTNINGTLTLCPVASGPCGSYQ